MSNDPLGSAAPSADKTVDAPGGPVSTSVRTGVDAAAATDAFLTALGGDVVIEGVAKPGPLPVGDVMTTAEWWKRERHDG